MTSSSPFNLLQLPFPKSPPSTSSFCLHHRPLPLSSTFCRHFTAASSFSSGDISVSPALSSANILYFRSGYNVQIVVDEDEPEEVLLRRFRREVSKAGVIQECRRRRYFENKNDEKKRKKREAGKRNRRR